MYADNVLAKAKPVDISVKGAEFEEVLKAIFSEQPLSYKIDKKTITVVAKEGPSFLERVIDRIMAIDVRGQVVDEKGEPLAGATVKVKGTGQAVTTDGQGKFYLQNVSEDEVLEVSYIGYEKQEVRLVADLVIVLKMASSDLQEVVVNKGYYTETQKLTTSSVSKITWKDIQQQPVNNILGAMIGRMAGVQVIQQSGLSGGGFDIQIRGLNSLRTTASNNGNRPLYIIDGVPFNSTSLSQPSEMLYSGLSPFAAISPGDIESIEVLKDADATAIYGSRGANGIVLITTKKGKSGKSDVTVDFSQGIGTVPKFLDLLTTEQYLEMRKEAYANDNIQPSGTNGRDLLDYDQHASTDFQRLLFDNIAAMTNVRATVSGGTTNTNFLVGTGYSRETAVLNDNSSDNKFSANFRINNTSDNKEFRLSFGGMFIANSSNLGYFGLKADGGGIDLAPNSPSIYNDLGKLNFDNGFNNPFAKLQERFISSTQNLNLNSSVEYDILNHLTLKSTVGYSTIRTDNIGTRPIASKNPAEMPTGLATFTDGKSNTWIFEPQLRYQNSFKKITLDVLLGGTIQSNVNNKETLQGLGYSNDAFIENLLAAPTITPGGMDYVKFKYAKSHARINVNYDQKYILNLTASRDGSSRFGPNKRFSNFGAVGLAWVFSESKFVQDNLEILNFGKLRGSYGVTGSDNIPDYGFLDTYSSTMASPYDGVNSLVPARLFNSEFAWEKNRKLELAFDLGFVADRINISVNWYKNRSSNQLVGYPLSTVTGFSSLPYYNLPATVQNTGFESMVSAEFFKSEHFMWRSSLNITLPKNKLVSYPDLENSTYNNLYVVGQPITIVKRLKYNGVNPKTGLYQFDDVDENGVINELDRQTLLDVSQKYYGGWQNSLVYKNFEFSLFVQFVKQLAESPINSYAPAGRPGNQLGIMMDRWQRQGDEAKYQRFFMSNSEALNAYNNAKESDFAYEDGSFIRLKNVSITYKIPSGFLQKSGIRNANVFLQGQNLLTLTRYNGLDPETKNYNTIPTLRVMSAGFQLYF
ncbi:MAG TPA: SusC/RagA family TonB-linked outer membrane protein [Pedobacter sp.]|nr:SusC/RagA family TonB-linked outer membrane protein [Pedobacter sp.]